MRASESIGRRIELDPPNSSGGIWNLPEELFNVGFEFNDAHRKFDKPFVEKILPRRFFCGFSQVSLFPGQSHCPAAVFAGNNMHYPANRGFDC